MGQPMNRQLQHTGLISESVNEVFASEDETLSENVTISDQNNPLFVFDILSEIFSYLDNFTVYLRCVLVCKTWRYCAWHLLDEFNFRYDDLDLLFYGKEGERIAKQFNPSLGRSEAVRLNNTQMLEYMLNLIVRNARYLKKFNVVGAQQNEDIKKMINDERIALLMRSCSENLEMLDLSSCDNLKEVSYSQILNKCRKTLKSLKLRCSLSIRDTFAKDYISTLESLEYLNLSKCCYIGLYSLIPISTNCTKLRVLDVSGCTSFYGFSFLRNCTVLEELHVQTTYFSSDDFQYIPNSLKILDVQNCEQVRRLNHVANLEHLEEINLSYNNIQLEGEWKNHVMKWKILKAISVPVGCELLDQTPYLKHLEIGFLEASASITMLSVLKRSHSFTEEDSTAKLSTNLKHLLITDSHLTHSFVEELKYYCPSIVLKTRRCNI
ncbi:F-box and leucine-rich repeat protein [Naegleria gruberi]|uniref:F-box and leucine-rich repeat protein n=1 Tax=Naegleria gruberi TaxID=5762 RepID=D2V063_NAEGR|nr:F-box and leucine-rich repeat protein [Naegleria gruberi]EFC49474.1 F-box and leucine-rich repeat protein [Naegleria gruberi]|eukprot:XP_002682218.1 F-box and leucine-rich repeat protein [Naegleria gruberi strain NEG-M]